MSKRMFASFLMLLGVVVAAVPFASAQAEPELLKADVSITDQAALQRGAKYFFNYCAACHSLHFMRYSRLAEDLGLTEQEVMQNLNFTQVKYREQAVSTMPEEDATKWFGKAPPDLSLEIGAKGADWVYSYLNSFYLDPTRPVGWNNSVFPNASMPNVLWELQGLQVARYGKADNEGDPAPILDLELVRPGSMTPAEYHQATRDITAFLQYVSEPAALKRRAIAPWVLLFLVVLTGLFWLLKREYWKDVH